MLDVGRVHGSSLPCLAGVARLARVPDVQRPHADNRQQPFAARVGRRQTLASEYPDPVSRQAEDAGALLAMRICSDARGASCISVFHWHVCTDLGSANSEFEGRVSWLTLV